MPQSSFAVESHQQGDSETLVVHGDIDLFTAPLLRREVEQTTAPRVIIDLSETGFMDSTGLGVLVAHHRSLEQAGRMLVIRCPHRTLRSTFEVTGLDKLFHFDPELAAA